MTKAELIAAMDAHDAEGARLEKAMTDLGLDAKALKAIRKAEKAAEKARATLAELMGEPVVGAAPETLARENADDTIDDPDAPAPETPKKGGK